MHDCHMLPCAAGQLGRICSARGQTVGPCTLQTDRWTCSRPTPLPIPIPIPAPIPIPLHVPSPIPVPIPVPTPNPIRRRSSGLPQASTPRRTTTALPRGLTVGPVRPSGIPRQLPKGENFELLDHMVLDAVTHGGCAAESQGTYVLYKRSAHPLYDTYHLIHLSVLQQPPDRGGAASLRCFCPGCF